MHGFSTPQGPRLQAGANLALPSPPPHGQSQVWLISSLPLFSVFSTLLPIQAPVPLFWWLKSLRLNSQLQVSSFLFILPAAVGTLFPNAPNANRMDYITHPRHQSPAMYMQIAVTDSEHPVSTWFSSPSLCPLSPAFFSSFSFSSFSVFLNLIFLSDSLNNKHTPFYN